MSVVPDMRCPSGAQFYACGEGSRFVGCCNVNPCSSVGCAAGNLVSTSFDPSQYGQIPDQECAAGDFYTCTGTSPPFWGCCESNPCSGGGCPSDKLAGAMLSDNENTAQQYLQLNSTWEEGTSTSTSTSSPVTLSTVPATTLLTSSTTSTRSSEDTAETTTTDAMSSASSTSITDAAATATTGPASVPTVSSQSSSPAGPIAGGVVGGLAVLAALIFGLVWLLRRSRKPKSTATDDPTLRPESEIQQSHETSAVLPAKPEMINTKYNSGGYQSTMSPVSPQQPPYSPGPPSYHFDADGEDVLNRPMSYELPGSAGGYEMDGGQRYHAYRPN